MNLTMGRFIDELTDEQRDRLVEAEDFTTATWWEDGYGCLCGTALLLNTMEKQSAYAARNPSSPFIWPLEAAQIRYIGAIVRFGKARVVRAIKLRAGARIETPIPVIQNAVMM